MSGSSNETRNDITIYHPEMQSGSQTIYLHDFPDLYHSRYESLKAESLVKFYPSAEKSIPTIAVAWDDAVDSRVFIQVPRVLSI